MNFDFFGIFKVLTIGLFIAGCAEPIQEVDISKTEINLNIRRFEYDLFANAPDQLDEAYVSRLRQDYGSFYKLFVENIISVGRSDDSVTTYYLNHFRSDLHVKEVVEASMRMYPDLDLFTEEFTPAFKRYKTLFPEKSIPEIITFISAFSYTLVVD